MYVYYNEILYARKYVYQPTLQDSARRIEKANVFFSFLWMPVFVFNRQKTRVKQPSVLRV